MSTRQSGSEERPHPRGMSESKLPMVHKINLNHTWTVCEIANSNQSQGVHFSTAQHLTHQPTRSKLGIKAVFLNNELRHSLGPLEDKSPIWVLLGAPFIHLSGATFGRKHVSKDGYHWRRDHGMI